jgi:glycosyltransferase involved in cell wall biosynthesis
MMPDAASHAPVILHTRVVSGTGGGPEKTIFNSPRFLRQWGYEALCAYMHPPGDPGFEQLADNAAQSGARLVSVPDRGAWDYRVVRRLLDVCRSERVAVWHGHDYKSNALGLLLRRFWPMRLVTTVHGWVKRTRRTPLYYWIDRASLRHYERVICVSPDLREACLASGVRPERCLLVENAIDTDQYARRSSSTAAKAALGLPSDRPIVGAVGRLSEEKGFDRLILAADRLLASGLNLHLVIIGEGDQRAKLAALIARLGRQDAIRLVGYQSAMAPWYEALDAFVLSSLREGLPNVLLEAMALEVPVIATRVAGVPRLIEDGINGLVVEPDDVTGLTAALRQVLETPPLRSRMAGAGRRTIEERYSFAVRMDKIRRIYDDLLGSDSEGPACRTGLSESPGARHCVEVGGAR